MRYHRSILQVAGLILVSVLLGAAAVLGLQAPAGATSPVAPHIVARPDSVMVKQPVSLHGIGFEPRSRLTLAECSQTTWMVAQKVCVTDNRIEVRTDSQGSFRATMKAEICPAVSPPIRTERTCYIGEPLPNGLDTIGLVGAARITVSWP